MREVVSDGMGKIEGKPCCRAIVRHGMAYGHNGKQKGMGNKRAWAWAGTAWHHGVHDALEWMGERNT